MNLTKVIALTVLLFKLCSASAISAEESSAQDANMNAAGGKWKLVWSDEFDGTELNHDNWSLHKAAYSNDEQSYYSIDNVTISDGMLTLNALKSSNPDNKLYVSGAIDSKGKFSQTYGRFEARIKLPVGQGYWPAFWLMPEDMVIHGPWPACGEIDIMETGGDTNNFCGTLHFGGVNNQHAAKGIGSVKLPNNGRNDEFHVYAIEWEPTEMRWYCDNILMGTVKHWSTFGPHGQEQQPLPAPFNKDFYIILNLAVGGKFVGNKLPEENNTNGQMTVDYVRVYTKDAYTMPVFKPTRGANKTYMPTGKNLVSNGSFNDTSELYWKNQGFKIDMPVIKDGNMVVRISGDVHEQHMQLFKYDVPLQIKQGTRYRLSFKARSDVACKQLRPVVERPKANWAKLFLYSSLDLNTEMKEFSFDFTATDSDNDAALLFYTGIMPGDIGGGNNTIYIADIMLQEMVEQVKK